MFVLYLLFNADFESLRHEAGLTGQIQGLRSHELRSLANRMKIIRGLNHKDKISDLEYLADFAERSES